MDIEAAQAAHENLVAVILENLFLGQAVFELHGDHCLGQLARNGGLPGEEEIARELLSQCRRAAWLGPSHDAVDCRARGADEVDASVAEKPVILDRDDGVN